MEVLESLSEVIQLGQAICHASSIASTLGTSGVTESRSHGVNLVEQAQFLEKI